MTLSNRNYFFKAGIVISAVNLIGIAVVSYKLFPLFPNLISASIRRSESVIQALVGRFLSPAPYVPFVTIITAVVYALITLILIYYFFEKTQSPEILFISLFALSFAFESARLIIPSQTAWKLPGLYLIASYRLLLFGRYAGVFSLFAAGVCASGFEIRKPGNVILLISGAALIIALGVPIDGLSWDSALGLNIGYASMFKMVETGIILITTVSFFVSAYTRAAREYLFIGIGTLLVCIGRNMLFVSDTWVTPLPALAILVAGTWFICHELHQIYLWL
jgi:hypothetical protein